MCSFLVTTLHIVNLLLVNYYMAFRGPDKTNMFTHERVTFVHNLLHLTGVRTVQPFYDKSNEVVCLFNGEIYNYKALGEEFGKTYASDGYCLTDMYHKYGEKFPQRLDGEFALVCVDFRNGLIVSSTDVFGIKPLWYAVEDGEIGLASYESALLRLGFRAPIEQDPNAIVVLDLRTLRELRRHAVHAFDLRQYKTDTRDWQAAFERAVSKRIGALQYDVFIGLSGGYDSGAISCALNRLGQKHYAFTILGNEGRALIERRLDRTRATCTPFLYDMSVEQFRQTRAVLERTCEPYQYHEHDGSRTPLLADKAATGLAFICGEAKSRGMRIYLSGSGADEIISDYGFNGVKFYPHSSFGGKFPERLEDVFPWRSFFLGTQRNYLRKEEYVAGAYSMEGRYPFLDTDVVQEYLWLAASVKNSLYKRPIHDYLTAHQYPFEPGHKIGFSTLSRTRTVFMELGDRMGWLASGWLLLVAVAAIALLIALHRRHFWRRANGRLGGAKAVGALLPRFQTGDREHR